MNRDRTALRFLIPAASAVALVLAVHIGLKRNAEPSMRDTLQQIGVALRMYAIDNGDRYPPKSALPGEFCPDLTCLGDYFSSSRAGRRTVSALKGEDEHALCYLGHMVLDEEMALHLLNQYEVCDPFEVREAEVHLERDARFNRIMRLREGVERLFIHTLGNSVYREEGQSNIPVLWEAPQRGSKDEALVLYMDGHVESKPFPGTFPLTEAFVRRTREMMHLPVSEVRDGIPSAEASPVAEAVEAIFDVGTRWAPLHEHWEMASCDQNPSVSVAGHEGYRVVFNVGQRQYTHEDAFLRARGLSGIARSVPRELRKIPRTSLVRIESFEVVLFDSHVDVSPSFKESIDWVLGEPSSHVTVDLGLGMGYRWFGNMRILRQELLRQHCGLSGGDDRYQLFAGSGQRDTSRLWRLTALKPFVGLEDEEKHSALARICAAPTSFREYRAATEAKRDLEGNPVPAEVCGAECVLLGQWACFDYYQTPRDLADQARDVLMASADEEAVMLVALDLALTVPGKICGLRERHQAGLDMLRQLPGGPATRILEHLAEHVQISEQKDLCRQLLSQLVDSEG